MGLSLSGNWGRVDWRRDWGEINNTSFFTWSWTIVKLVLGVNIFQFVFVSKSIRPLENAVKTSHDAHPSILPDPILNPHPLQRAATSTVAATTATIPQSPAAIPQSPGSHIGTRCVCMVTSNACRNAVGHQAILTQRLHPVLTFERGWCEPQLSLTFAIPTGMHTKSGPQVVWK